MNESTDICTGRTQNQSVDLHTITTHLCTSYVQLKLGYRLAASYIGYWGYLLVLNMNLFALGLRYCLEVIFDPDLNIYGFLRSQICVS